MEILMTYADVLKIVLNEVSGLTHEQIDANLEIIRKKAPNSKLDEEIPSDRAKMLLVQLREQGPGVLAWLVRGAVEVFKNSGTA